MACIIQVDPLLIEVSASVFVAIAVKVLTIRKKIKVPVFISLTDQAH